MNKKKHLVKVVRKIINGIESGNYKTYKISFHKDHNLRELTISYEEENK